MRPTGVIAGTEFALSRSGSAVVKLSRDVFDLEFRDNTGVPVYRAAIAATRALHAA